MAEINEILKEAEILYNNGLYSEAAKKCLEVIKSGECLKEAYLLWSKSYLFMLPLTESANEEYTKTLFDAILKGLAFAETIEEVFEIEADILSATNEWERRETKRQLDFIIENPTLKNWQTHLNARINASKLGLFISLYTVKSPVFLKFQKELGEEPRVLREKYGLESKNQITDEEKCELYFSAGCKIFEEAFILLEEYKNTSFEAFNTVKDRLLNGLLLAPLVMKIGIKDGISDELERLRRYADSLNCIINAEVFPNGKRIILFKDCNNEIKDLENAYKRIKALDSSFVIPQIVKPVPDPTPAPANSGGCYVATAVYGSYDCPQVWTLRRFRDETLAETWYGRMFIRTYYAVSPTLVKWFGESEWFKNMWKPKLDKMVKKLNEKGVEDTAYNDRKW